MGETTSHRRLAVAAAVCISALLLVTAAARTGAPDVRADPGPTGAPDVRADPGPTGGGEYRALLPSAMRQPVARPFASDLKAAQVRYPHIVGTQLSHCRLCHELDEPFGMNPYGMDYKLSGRSFAAIEPLDSDGDGFSNLVEIEALSFPGFAGSRPYRVR